MRNLGICIRSVSLCRMVSECYKKCMHTSRSDQLEIGEMSCIDRCVPKYFEVHEMVQGEFAKFSGAGAASS